MKQIISNYTFDKTAKTVTLNDFATVDLGRLLLITNVTAGVIIYQFNNTSLGASASGNIVTLNYNTGSMSNTDKLQIIYESTGGDPVYQPAAPVNQGNLDDQLDTVAIRGLTSGLDGLAVSSVTDLVPPTDVSKFSTIVVRLTGTWVAFVQFSFSPDGINWNAYQAVGTNSTFAFPRLNSYFKASVITYTSGTVEGTLRLFALPINLAIGNNSFPVPPYSNFTGMQDSSGFLAGIRSSTAVGDGGSGNQLLAVEGFAFNGANHDRLRAPSVFKTVQLTASGSNAVWTPAAGRRFRLMGYTLEVTANAAQSSGGVVTMQFLDAAGGMGLTHDVFVPGTAGTTMGSYGSGMVGLGNGKLSAAANNVLNLNLSSALTSGVVRVNVFGTEE